jgi:hypothetical protein
MNAARFDAARVQSNANLIVKTLWRMSYVHLERGRALRNSSESRPWPGSLIRSAIGPVCGFLRFLPDSRDKSMLQSSAGLCIILNSPHDHEPFS